MPRGSDLVDSNEVDRWWAENAELRQTVVELRRVLDQKQAAEARWTERQKDYEALLEEKSEVIRALHQQIRELEARPMAETPDEEELLLLAEELERDRQQLRQDEEALQVQMREMEVQISRERAELSRVRHELQLLHEDFDHELSVAARDAAIRDRLVALQERSHSLANRSSAPPSPTSAPIPEDGPIPPPTPAGGKRGSGFLRRLFGQGKTAQK
jgi:hypothetical protein